MSARLTTLASLLAAAALLSACDFGDSGPPNPAPGGVTTAPTSSGGGGSPPVEPVKRRVETRNPFGDILGNLLVDGDFELTAVVEGSGPQAGWYAFGQFGQQHIRSETGGLCKSGLRCGVIDAGVLMFGRGAAARDSGMIASVWIKPPPGKSCGFADVTLIRCNFNGNGTSLPPQGGEPDPEGWCRYANDMSAVDSSICMLVETTMSGSETALIDAATVLPANGTAPQRLMKPLSSSKQQRYRTIARKVRDLTPIGAPPPRALPIGNE